MRYNNDERLETADLHWLVRASSNAHSNWSIANFKRELVMFEAEGGVMHEIRRACSRLEIELQDFKQKSVLVEDHPTRWRVLLPGSHTAVSKREFLATMLHEKVHKHILNMLVSVDFMSADAQLRLEANWQSFCEEERVFRAAMAERGIFCMVV